MRHETLSFELSYSSYTSSGGREQGAIETNQRKTPKFEPQLVCRHGQALARRHGTGNGSLMWLWRTVGIIAFALGAIGLVLPVWPTTVFWIVAALAFAKSNPNWAEWIYRQPGIGPPIKTFLETGALAREAKIAALSGMAIAAGLIVGFGHDNRWLMACGLSLIGIGALYVITRKPVRPE
ncbi:MAG: hypothetical protein CMF04_05280 [Hyphomonas sp.]|nr:hypothetical protein [Hyphomonas sp.]